jgi:hypothetical protein
VRVRWKIEVHRWGVFVFVGTVKCEFGLFARAIAIAALCGRGRGERCVVVLRVRLIAFVADGRLCFG